MVVLHISNGFIGSKVHSQLAQHMDKVVDRQFVYSAIFPKDIGKNSFEAANTNIYCAPILRKWYRPFYHLKKWIVARNIQKHYDFSEIDCTHASTLFTDGVQSYEIYRRYNIPYIVAVRNTDLNLFLESCPYSWPLGKKTLLHASKIVFISKAMMDSFSEHKVIKPILNEIKDKFILVPNGIDDYWHRNISVLPRKGNNVLYVGDFGLNKNVHRVIEAIVALSHETEFKDIHLNLVGGGGNRNGIKGGAKKGIDLVQPLIEQYKDLITFYGPIYDKDKLREIYSVNDMFVMPSIHETFGLVYLEALSQNLPVVYTKGQGIDGLFGPEVGISVNPLSVDEIKNAIKTILSNHESYSNETVDFSCYNWDNIAKRYIAIYEEISASAQKK